MLKLNCDSTTFLEDAAVTAAYITNLLRARGVCEIQ